MFEKMENYYKKQFYYQFMNSLIIINFKNTIIADYIKKYNIKEYYTYF